MTNSYNFRFKNHNGVPYSTTIFNVTRTYLANHIRDLRSIGCTDIEYTVL